MESGEGLVLANTGADNLRSTGPVVAGDRLSRALIVMAKTPRRAEDREVRWPVELIANNEETAATDERLMMAAI